MHACVSGIFISTTCSLHCHLDDCTFVQLTSCHILTDELSQSVPAYKHASLDRPASVNEARGHVVFKDNGKTHWDCANRTRCSNSCGVVRLSKWEELRLYLALHRHHQKNSAFRWAAVWAVLTVHWWRGAKSQGGVLKPQGLKRKESQSGVGLNKVYSFDIVVHLKQNTIRYTTSQRAYISTALTLNKVELTHVYQPTSPTSRHYGKPALGAPVSANYSNSST